MATRAASAAMADMKKSKAPAKVDPINMPTADRKAANAVEAKKKAKAEFKPPKNLAQCADMYYTKREARLALEKQVAAIQAEESACREYLIANLPKSDASGIAGKVCRVAVENKMTAQVQDWDALHAYIHKNVGKNPGLWGMLQRRVNESMIKEIWESGKKVPGVEPLDVPVLRCNKL